ncbi:MAG: hypothetical protein ACKOVA_12955 [Novosphingobium sp.]
MKKCQERQAKQITHSELENLYQIHRDYIIHEDGLINNRVGWFIQLHSFLLATYGIVLSSAVSTFFPDNGNVPEEVSKQIKTILSFVLSGITIVGICSAISAGVAIWGAHKAIEAINGRWTTLDPSEKLPGLIGGGRYSNDRAGAVFHHFLPVAMVVLWLISLFVPQTIYTLAGN